MADRDAERLLKKLVDGNSAATAEERARAVELMKKDPALAKQHRAMVEAERALAGGPLDVPSAAELDALLPRVLDAVAERPVARSPRLFAMLGVPALAAAAVALLFVVTNKDDEFTARGTGDADVVPLEVFCVENGAPRALSVSAPTCPVGATLVIGLPTSLAGEVVRLGFVDSARVEHRAQGGDAAAPDTARVPDTGLPPLYLDIAAGWATGRGDVVVDVKKKTARRPVDVVR